MNQYTFLVHFRDVIVVDVLQWLCL